MTTFIPGLYTGVPRFEVFLDNPCRQSREEQPNIRHWRYRYLQTINKPFVLTEMDEI